MVIMVVVMVVLFGCSGANDTNVDCGDDNGSCGGDWG